jgi:hypothetical protein
VEGAPPVKLQVKKCQLFGSYWIVGCKLQTAPTPEVLHALGQSHH